MSDAVSSAHNTEEILAMISTTIPPHYKNLKALILYHVIQKSKQLVVPPLNVMGCSQSNLTLAQIVHFKMLTFAIKLIEYILVKQVADHTIILSSSHVITTRNHCHSQYYTCRENNHQNSNYPNYITKKAAIPSNRW